MPTKELEQRLSLSLSFPGEILALVTLEEERAERLLVQVSKEQGRPLVIWTVSLGFGKGEFTQPSEALQRARTVKEPVIFFFKDLHSFLHEPSISRGLRDLSRGASRRGQSLVLLTPSENLPEEIGSEAESLILPLPGRRDMRELLLRVGRGQSLQGELLEEMVRGALGLTERQARRAFLKALREEDAQGRVAVVLQEKAHLLRSSDALDFYDRPVGIEQVGGLGELKRWVQERADAFSERAREFGLPQPRGLLLLGVQGCGKSLTAKAVASLWKLPLLRLDLAAAYGSSSGPERSLRQAMQVSEALAPSVLWVDEIDKSFAGAVEEGGASMRVLGSFVTWLQEKKGPVFVIATANDIASLPPELLRKGRFDEIFFVDLPDRHERESILAIHVKQRGREPGDFDLPLLAERGEHFSGAELEQVVVAGLYRAFSRKRELEQEDLSIALEETVPLYETYEERIKELREWARRRTRKATADSSLLDLFKTE